MTEYINKLQAMDIIANGKNDKAFFGTTNKDWEVIDFLKIIPAANVIEKEKIDRAIKRINGLIDYYTTVPGEEKKVTGLFIALDILKDELGEK